MQHRHPATESCRCQKCGRVDPTLRVTVFTWVVSLLVITYRRGWAKILCARCRTKYALLFDLQNFFMGWWGIPFGIFWTLQALWHNSMGGQQPAENNALFLAGLGYEFHRKGDLKAAVSALKASLRFKKDPRVEAFYWQTQGQVPRNLGCLRMRATTVPVATPCNGGLPSSSLLRSYAGDIVLPRLSVARV